jgi:DNA-binding transcriptional regulator GbsR (MarR family)
MPINIMKRVNSICSVLTEHTERRYSTDMEDINKKQQFVEDCGLYFERVGLTRVAGRIIGWLLVCHPPHQQQSDLVEALQASKSTISVALNVLTTLYLVERFTLPGDRRTYYRTSKDMWSRSFRARMHQVTELKQLGERGLEALKDEPPERRQRLEFMRDMNAFMEAEFPKLLDRWDEIKKAKGYDNL